MNSFRPLASLALLLTVATVAVAATTVEKMMEEMGKCDVCKTMVDKPELMEHSTWESHKIDNGMLCVMNVPKEYQDQFNAAHAEMMRQIAQVKANEQAGHETHLCSFCRSMADLEKAGAKQQEIKTETGAVTLVTSQDPSVIAKIHATADQAIEVQKQLKEATRTAAK